jgi:hypothetical protein
MKRSLKWFVFMSMVLAMVFSASMFTFAADGKKDARENDRIARMKEMLGLSDDQVSKIRQISTDSMTRIEPLQKQRQTDLKALRDKVKAEAPDADLKVLMAALQADDQKLVDARKIEMDQIKAVLTTLQQATLMIREPMGRWNNDRDLDKDDKSNG